MADKISADQAVDIAKEHGLGLHEAAAIRELASDEDHANDLAARFAPDAGPEELADAVRRKQGRIQ